MSERYSEMTLRIADDKVRLVVSEVPAHLDLEKLEDFELLTARVFSSLASRETVEWWRQAIECIGSSLYNMLFAKEQLVEGFRKGIEKADAERSVCRIGLEFGVNANQKANALTFLPWEFLYAPRGIFKDADVGVFLGADSRFALYRKITAKAREPKNYHYHCVRLLIIIADPADPPEISIEPLLAKLDELGARRAEDLEDLERERPPEGMEYFVEVNPGRQRLQQVVASPAGWDVIHFVGHSGFFRKPDDEHGGGKVALVEGDEKRLYDATDFAAWLARPMGAIERTKNTTTDLVVLQTCEGGTGDSDLWSGFRGVAPRVAAEGFPAVVAMQYQVLNETANRFSARLYEALKRGWPVDRAVQAGRLALALEDPKSEFASRDFASPVLFSTGGQLVLFPRVEAGGEERTVAEAGAGVAGKTALPGTRGTDVKPAQTPAGAAPAPVPGERVRGDLGAREPRSGPGGAPAGEREPQVAGSGRFGVEADAKLEE